MSKYTPDVLFAIGIYTKNIQINESEIIKIKTSSENKSTVPIAISKINVPMESVELSRQKCHEVIDSVFDLYENNTF